MTDVSAFPPGVADGGFSLAEPVLRTRGSPGGTHPVDSATPIRDAIRSFVARLSSYENASFVIYRARDLSLLFTGRSRSQRISPFGLEFALLAPMARGFVCDVSILEPRRRWVTIICRGVGRPASEIEWLSPRVDRVGEPWTADFIVRAALDAHRHNDNRNLTESDAHGASRGTSSGIL